MCVCVCARNVIIIRGGEGGEAKQNKNYIFELDNYVNLIAFSFCFETFKLSSSSDDDDNCWPLLFAATAAFILF